MAKKQETYALKLYGRFMVGYFGLKALFKGLETFKKFNQD